MFSPMPRGNEALLTRVPVEMKFPFTPSSKEVSEESENEICISTLLEAYCTLFSC